MIATHNEHLLVNDSVFEFFKGTGVEDFCFHHNIGLAEIILLFQFYIG